ncbi:MAG: site-specific DNA-methyltransferase [Ignavibacteriaceae bacterium]|nr:site-specific DNA-methyltransferase [Ignavibacteriaceae bacterium]
MRNIILQGNVLERLKDMEAGRVHCMITSPPYYGVRNYGTQPQIWKPEGYTACGEHEFYEGEKKHNLGGCSSKSTLRDTPGQKAKENWAKGVSCEHEFDNSISVKDKAQKDFSKSGLKNDGRPEEKRIATLINSKYHTCEHEFEEKTNQLAEGKIGAKTTLDYGNAKNNNNSYATKKKEYVSGFCLKCGAWKGELGLEPTPELYIEHVVQIFREIKRVLRKDGTAWLNLGDSYWGSGNASGHTEETENFGLKTDSYGTTKGHTTKKHTILKPKDLIGIPWRVAIALQQDGWWLRSDIIWSKKNPMPESVTDRPTKAHEYIFLLTKSQKYYYDAEAIREEPASGPSDLKKMYEQKDRIGGKTLNADDPLYKANMSTNIGQKRGVGDPSGRNKRSVWEVTTTPFAEAHFATFPQKLIEPCILAGTSERGVCAECGKPYERILEKVSKRDFLKDADKQYRSRATEHQITPKDQPNRGSVDRVTSVNEDTEQKMRMYNSKYNEAETGQQLNAFMREQTIVAERDESRIEAEELYPGDPLMQKKYINYIHEHGQLRKTKTIGWKKTCKCETDKVKPAIVLDPFFGAGTTGLVALRSGRNFIGIELNENYIKIAEKRLAPFMLNLFDQPEEEAA